MIADVDEEKGREAIVKLANEFGRGKVAFIQTDVSDGAEFESKFYFYAVNLKQFPMNYHNTIR